MLIKELIKVNDKMFNKIAKKIMLHNTEELQELKEFLENNINNNFNSIVNYFKIILTTYDSKNIKETLRTNNLSIIHLDDYYIMIKKCNDDLYISVLYNNYIIENKISYNNLY